MSSQWCLEAIVGLLGIIALHIGAIKIPTLPRSTWVCVGIATVIMWWMGWLG